MILRILSVNHPEWMDQDDLAKELWYAVSNTVTAMNVAQESDRAALELLSICLAEVRKAYLQLEREGHTTMTEVGGEKLSPYFNIMMQTMKQAVLLMKEFGMTPAARTRVKSMAAGKEESKLSQFLKGSSE